MPVNTVTIVLILISLGVAHFLGDYFLQIALQKILKIFGMKYTKFGSWQIWVHCVTYLLFFIPVFLVFEISWWWLVFLFFAHFAIDNRVENLKVKRSYRDLGYIKRLLKFDVGLITDQGSHLVCLIVIFFVWLI